MAILFLGPATTIIATFSKRNQQIQLSGLDSTKLFQTASSLLTSDIDTSSRELNPFEKNTILKKQFRNYIR